MTEVLDRKPGSSSLSVISSARHDPAARLFNADLMAALAAILLPWSTTGTTIAIGLWVVALAFTDLRQLPPSLLRAECLLPIALFALALTGTLWSDAPWPERIQAIGPAAKLLALPLLLYQFERSPRGHWVFMGFAASCVLLMLLSFLVALEPMLSLKLYLAHRPSMAQSGIAVRNYIDQSQEFALCAIGLACVAAHLFRTGSVRMALLSAAVAAGFVANMLLVVVSRTTLVTLPVILTVLAVLRLPRRRAAVLIAALALLLVAGWYVSPHLRNTIDKFSQDYESTTVYNEPSGMGSRLEYWRKSLLFIAAAPLIGHGTGSTRGLFERAATGQIGFRGEVVANPHNQTLNVAIQWGVLGVIVLYAMWLAHLRLFRDDGLAGWIGLVVVVQNILSSLLNSHLFDFTEGWLYVLGVGIAAGMMRRQAKA